MTRAELELELERFKQLIMQQQEAHEAQLQVEREMHEAARRSWNEQLEQAPAQGSAFG